MSKIINFTADDKTLEALDRLQKGKYAGVAKSAMLRDLINKGLIEEKNYLTKKEAARVLNICPRQIDRLISAGKLEKLEGSYKVLISIASIEAYKEAFYKTDKEDKRIVIKHDRDKDGKPLDTYGVYLATGKNPIYTPFATGMTHDEAAKYSNSLKTSKDK